MKPTHLMRKRILLGMTLVALTGVAMSADWPDWRGPNRDAHSPDTQSARSWPADGPRLLWKTRGLGAGYATVTLVGDRIYTAGDEGETARVVALDRNSGRQVWAARLGKAGGPGWGNFKGVRAVPAVDGDLLVALGQYGELAAYEAATGKERWRVHLVEDLGGTLPEWGFSETPLIDGDQVVCTPGGEEGAIVALDRRTGRVRWRSGGFTDAPHYSSLVKARIHGVTQYVQLTAEHVVGVAAETGQVLWQAERRGRTAVIPTPVVRGDKVYVTSGYGTGCHLFQISRKEGGFTAEQRYANKIMKNHHGGVVLVGDHIYGYSDGVGWVCQAFDTGEMVWREKAKTGKGSCVYVAGMLVLREEKKGSSQVVLIEATADGYRERGRFQPPEQSDLNAWPHPVVLDGRLYLRDQDLLLCYDVAG